MYIPERTDKISINNTLAEQTLNTWTKQVCLVDNTKVQASMHE